MDDVRPAASEKRVFLLGGSGTIGRATVRALVEQRHDVVCFVRDARDVPDGATARIGDVTDPASLARDGLCGEHFDVLVSCLASRTGAPRDAWAIDYRTHVDALAVAKAAGVTHMVLLSAICVQKPLLAFQHAKLAFERVLIESGLTYSIVRPTAFFKSLSGQVDRVRLGKPFLVFGDGALTACKPISNNDLARYIAACIDDSTRHNKILPVGGPGAAITPRQQGEYLFALLGMTPRFRHVPVAMLDVIIAILSAVGRVVPAVAAKAELARIGRYYATESMLVLNAETGGYDADATPAFGSDTLFDYYERLVKGEAVVERGDHAVF
jgi:divinyl chlorophyllide a 8-vinyl-reductase